MSDYSFEEGLKDAKAFREWIRRNIIEVDNERLNSRRAFIDASQAFDKEIERQLAARK